MVNWNFTLPEPPIRAPWLTQNDFRLQGQGYATGAGGITGDVGEGITMYPEGWADGSGFDTGVAFSEGTASGSGNLRTECGVGRGCCGGEGDFDGQGETS